MNIKVPKQRKQNPNDAREFVLLDFMGNEIRQGDTCIVASGSSYSSYLMLSLILEVRKCPKSVRIYYQKVGQSWDYGTYTSVDYSQSNTRNMTFYRLADLSFDLEKKDAARLFAAQAEFNATNPRPKEVEDIVEDDED